MRFCVSAIRNKHTNLVREQFLLDSQIGSTNLASQKIGANLQNPSQPPLKALHAGKFLILAPKHLDHRMALSLEAIDTMVDGVNN